MRTTPEEKFAISICLPVYQGEQFLAEAIESVLAQTHTNFELIIVDDCSSDRTASIVESYLDRDPRIRFFKNKERLGLFENYNACLRLARFDYIKPFAQDDRLEPTFLARCLETLQKHPEVVLVSARRNWISESGEDLSHVYGTPFASDYFEDSSPCPGTIVIEESLRRIENFIGEPTCVMFRFSDRTKVFDPAFNHMGDLDLWLRLLKEGDFAFIDDTLTSFRRHANNTTNTNLKTLAIAPDLMRFYNNFNNYCSLDAQQFLENSVALIAAQYKSIVSSDSNQVSLFQQLSRFELEALLGKTLLAMDSKPDFDLEELKLAESASRLETKLRELLEDPVWRMTRPIREIRKLFLNDTNLSEYRTVGWSQRDYVYYLAKEIRSIKMSRSYKLKRLFKGPGSSQSKSLPRMLSRLKSNATLERQNGSLAQTTLKSQPLQVLLDGHFDSASASAPQISVLIGYMRHSPIKTLAALLKQSKENSPPSSNTFEVICVDASGDNKLEAELSEWIKNNQLPANWRILKAARGGRAFANNIALKEARAPLVLFLGSDFVPADSNFVERHLRFHQESENHNLIAVGGAFFGSDGGYEPTKFQKWLDRSGRTFGEVFTVEPGDFPERFFYVANTSLRKDLVIRAGFFDEAFEADAWDDFEFGLRLFSLGCRSKLVEDCLCIHDHPVSFLERIEVMKTAARAAAVLDTKVPGEFDWHKELEILPRKYLGSALREYCRYLVSKESVNLERFWEQSLKAAFNSTYRKDIEHHHKLLLAR
ncbi:MAG: glycosyltransferase [Candidatus Obscuribacterales bacterium]|nr:glycosyltransferase [Candidatus Obscuribacterales bacterium]